MENTDRKFTKFYSKILLYDLHSKLDLGILVLVLKEINLKHEIITGIQMTMHAMI